jgi:prepilin-type N-terminal cleavage/methylation domain-containing protein
MRAATARRSQGFTLLELMIVVAIIGVLASVAIPSFRNYQMNAKRSEAYANLSALAKAQKSYFAEFNEFVPAAPEPGATTGQLPGGTKRDVASVSTAYSAVGWTPEGDVFFDYDTIVDGFGGCSCATCFTATAYGNLDGDAFMSEFVYFHPDAAGGWCGVGVSGHGPPADPVTGDTQWDQVVRHPSSDFF